MNRTIAVLVAVALLLAHVLAVYQDRFSSFAPPLDQAYVSYRVARNIVYEGQWVWHLGQPGIASYPSFLWVLVAAVPERLYLSTNVFCQTLGVIAALAAVVLASQFGQRRRAGLVAPIFLALCGGLAAAAANGMETTLFTAAVAASFLASERRWPIRLALAMTLATLLHPAGAVFAAALFAIELVRLASARRVHAEDSEPTMLSPFAAPLGALLFVGMMHRLLGASFVPTLPRIDVRAGLAYVRDFFVACPSAWLVAYPLLALVRGRLTRPGRRALFVAAAWFGVTALVGGNGLPFYQVMVPSLPLFFFAIQEGLMATWESPSPVGRAVAFVLVLVALAFCGLASKVPGDLGPIRAEAWHRAWLAADRPNDPTARSLGRIGLDEAIEDTERLRAIGLLLRDQGDQVGAGRTLLSPWPGALAYLSGMQVFDLLGRATPPPGQRAQRPWTGGSRSDVVAALERQPDFVVATLRRPPTIPSPREVAEQWLAPWDERSGRVDALERTLDAYELVSVPISVGYRWGAQDETVQLLLRRTDLGLSPRLSLALEGDDGVAIYADHRGHPQLASLRVTIVDDRGQHWMLRPTGTPERDVAVYARTGILLYASGSRSIRLMVVPLDALPDGARPVEIRARLDNPGAAGDHRFVSISDEVSLRL